MLSFYFSHPFFYALDRTDGNVFKSLLFALYFLAIKIGLIGPNIPLELNQDQPNQQLVSRVQPIPVYNPYVSVLDDYRPSGLYMSKVERPSLVPQHSHSQKLINELRAGDSRVTVVTNNLDATTAKCGLSAGKTSSTAPTYRIGTEFTFWKTKARSIFLSTSIDV